MALDGKTKSDFFSEINSIKQRILVIPTHPHQTQKNICTCSESTSAILLPDRFTSCVGSLITYSFPFVCSISLVTMRTCTKTVILYQKYVNILHTVFAEMSG